MSPAISIDETRRDDEETPCRDNNLLRTGDELRKEPFKHMRMNIKRRQKMKQREQAQYLMHLFESGKCRYKNIYI